MKGRLKLKYVDSHFCGISDLDVENNSTRKMKSSINNFFSKCDHIRRKLRIWSHLLKKSFCAVKFVNQSLLFNKKKKLKLAVNEVVQEKEFA